MINFANPVAIKICGITNIADAMAAAAAGANMLGLNFSPLSRRCISPPKAREVIGDARTKFPQIKFVGVFVNQEPALVEELARDMTLDAVQLHGDEDLDYVRNLNAPFVIKAFRVSPAFSIASAANYDAVLLEGWSASAPGGTGEIFPWSIAAAARPLVQRLFLAGGLKTENVREAIDLVRPFAVDVCSGIEDAPGRKDHVELRRFIEAVRSVDISTHEKTPLRA